MDMVVILGLIAGATTTLSLVPQVLKAFRTKSTRDLSTRWILLMFAGLVLWLGYGLILGDLPIIAANTVSSALACSLLLAKRRFG